MSDAYIAPWGLDTNNGLSTVTPRRSLVKARELLGAGDTLWLMDGVYTTDTLLANGTASSTGAHGQEEFRVKSGTGWGVGNQITVEPINPFKAIFDFTGATLTTNGGAIRVLNSNYIEFKNFIVRNSAWRLIEVIGSTNIKLKNLKLINAQTEAITMGADDFLIEDVEVFHCNLDNIAHVALLGWDTAYRPSNSAPGGTSSGGIARRLHIHNHHGEGSGAWSADDHLWEDCTFQNGWSVCGPYLDATQNKTLTRCHARMVLHNMRRSLTPSGGSDTAFTWAAEDANDPEPDNIVFTDCTVDGINGGFQEAYHHHHYHTNLDLSYRNISLDGCRSANAGIVLGIDTIPPEVPLINRPDNCHFNGGFIGINSSDPWYVIETDSEAWTLTNNTVLT